MKVLIEVCRGVGGVKVLIVNDTRVAGPEAAPLVTVDSWYVDIDGLREALDAAEIEQLQEVGR